MTTKSDDTVNLEKARQFGCVPEDGHVFVIVDGEEYAVGHAFGASEDEALSYSPVSLKTLRRRSPCRVAPGQ